MLYPVAAGIWLLFAWRQLSAAPDYGDPSIPFRLGWLPPDWLSLYPNALAIAGLVVIGIVILRLDVPMGHPGVARGLSEMSRHYLLMQFYLLFGVLRKSEAISVDQIGGWIAGFVICAALLAVFSPGDWGQPDSDYSQLPKAERASPHWRLRYFYWNSQELSPMVLTKDGFAAAVNWASPLAQLQQLLLWSLPFAVFLW